MITRRPHATLRFLYRRAPGLGAPLLLLAAGACVPAVDETTVQGVQQEVVLPGAEQQPAPGETDDGRPRSVVQRRMGGPPPRRGLDGPNGAQFPNDVRTIDGSGNNVVELDWGAVGVSFTRMLEAQYADGQGAPSGSDRPNPRAISSGIFDQREEIPNRAGVSDFVWQWGQFLDHDIDETPVADPAEAFDIAVPAGDPWFDPQNTGAVTIPLDRSAYVEVNGVRQQFNAITAYIDASNVYGSEDERATALRTLDGTGRLAVSAGDLLPYNTHGLPNAPAASPNFFVAGDIRANEQVGLLAMHTLFVREHNHWADQIAAQDPTLDGEQIYQHARAIVAAEMQVITYREFLPKLLGPRAIPAYRGYREQVDPSISNEFATAAYRFGHSMLSPTLQRMDADGSEIGGGHLSLAEAFFAPEEIEDWGIDPVLRGLASQTAQQVDARVIDAVRNFLFGPPGAGGFDLVSLNIQRGRDHGLGTLNETRVALGLARHAGFTDLTRDVEVQQQLAAVYDHVDQVDLWVGGLAEDHVPGALVGETVYTILRDQFRRLRDGDRFWYQRYLPPDLVQLVESQTLAMIIRRNTDVGDELPDDVFQAVTATPDAVDVVGEAEATPQQR